MFNVYPEDEFALFAPPVTNTIQLPTQPIALGKADNLRVGMLFSGYGMAAADYFRISPINSSGLTGCFVLAQQAPFIAITWLDYGPLVQCGWQVDGVGAGFLTLTAISLNGPPAMRGYLDLFAKPQGFGIMDHAALNRTGRRVQARSLARRYTSQQERLLRQRAPQLFTSGG